MEVSILVPATKYMGKIYKHAIEGNSNTTVMEEKYSSNLFFLRCDCNLKAAVKLTEEMMKNGAALHGQIECHEPTNLMYVSLDDLTFSDLQVLVPSDEPTTMTLTRRDTNEDTNNNAIDEGPLIRSYISAENANFSPETRGEDTGIIPIVKRNGIVEKAKGRSGKLDSELITSSPGNRYVSARPYPDPDAGNAANNRAIESSRSQSPRSQNRSNNGRAIVTTTSSFHRYQGNRLYDVNYNVSGSSGGQESKRSKNADREEIGKKRIPVKSLNSENKTK